MDVKLVLVTCDIVDFLRKRGFSKGETTRIIETVLVEEGHPPLSVFDFVQGITAVARTKTHQDARLDLEGRAKKLLDRVGISLAVKQSRFAQLWHGALQNCL